MPTQEALQILTICADRVRSTSETFSVYTGLLEGQRWGGIAIKQFTGPVRAGQRWVVAGRKVVDPKWGEQFVAAFATPGIPETLDEVRLLLTSDLVPGWGYQHYTDLCQHFLPHQVVSVLRESMHRITEVESITADMYHALQAAYMRATGLAEVYAQLAEWGVRGRTPDRLVKAHGAETIACLKADPYADVLEVAGYGWRTAEAIATKLGIEVDDPRRINAGISVAIHGGTYATGNTWLTRAEAETATAHLLGMPLANVRPLFDDPADSPHIVRNGDCLQPAVLADAERLIAEHVVGRLSQTPLCTDQQVGRLDRPEQISDAQWAAVRMALTCPLSLLTGGPGVGKTTTLRALVGAARSLRLSVTCMAPTGKAAARMAEATGHAAATIHSTLRLIPGGAGDPDFEPLQGMIIVDEVSMLDTSLAAAMFDRIAPSAHIVLVGDPDQLPSVGPGAVLRDLLIADVLPRIHLDTVFRNDAGIAITAARIRSGQPLIRLSDVVIVGRETPLMAQQAICETVLRMKARGDNLHELLILTPKNDGETGRHELNRLLQPILNGAPEGSGISHYVTGSDDPDGSIERRSEEIRAGDRVMVTKNSTDLGVFNGQVGVVTECVGKGAIRVDLDGRLVLFAGEDKSSLTLAYAVTGHKAQGSEATAVIIPVFPSRVLCREWLYTAITRAKGRVLLVGDVDAMNACLHTQRSAERRTALLEQITAHLDVADPRTYEDAALYARAGESNVYHLRRAAAPYYTLCGRNTTGSQWGEGDIDSCRPCLQCVMSTGTPLAPYPDPAGGLVTGLALPALAAGGR